MAQFRTKARAVDLLGKGQIADLPTAITELWKNGYDAYADNLTAEIYLERYKGLISPLFVMTDDGKGMSRADIFEKWLVLGTDSKSRNESEQIADIDTLWKEPRIKAGEKGIGRLSVAFLGSPMLMLTKRLGYPLQAMFFDWRLLENYNLFLDDVQIPIADVSDSNTFRNIFDELKEAFLLNLEKTVDMDGNPIWENTQSALKSAIELSVINAVIPEFFETEILHDIIDLLDDHGTKFVIFEPIEQIIGLLNEDEENNDTEFVRTSLAGFTNQFVKDTLPVITTFPVHREIGGDIDYLTGSGNFFNYKDFDLADIFIDGIFDGSGSFKGKIKIYNNDPIDYVYTNPRRKDIRNYYGAFPMKLGYSLGERKDTKLDEGTFEEINKKVTAFGALYIYRDGFRVLPYGRTDYDFLEFEKRRSKRAGTSFFSHRRMFGFLGLTRRTNPDLKDKSSREGLINNAQYRVFKNDLEAFFSDIAREYFSDKARQSIFLNEKAEKNDQSEAIKKDKKRETVAKRNFTNSLKEYPKRFTEYQNKYSALLNELRQKNNNANVLYNDIENLLDDVQSLDVEYNNLLPHISKAYKPTEAQLQRLYDYENQLITFNENVKANSKDLIDAVRGKLEIKELQIEYTKQVERLKGELESIIFRNKQDLDSKFKQIADEYALRSNNILKEITFNNDTIIGNINSKEGAITVLKEVQQRFEFLREQINKELTPLVDHIKKLTFDIDEELVQGAYKAEYENIKYQWEQTRETAQLGIAVEIIDHEFNVLYSQINIMLQRLDKEIPDNAGSVFANLKRAFSSLEDKYALLSPLYRISGANFKNITCESIFIYLKDFFERKIREEEIQFEATPAFLNHIIEIKEPVIHTVFINIVNNAVYWLRNAEEKKILFDYFSDTKEILIINSGLPIESYRLDKIFALFYSNRPNGRGIGLYLSKQSLNENYFDIYATNDPLYNIYNGACFVIRPTTDR
jgi:signal transduction histidine kinase